MRLFAAQAARAVVEASVLAAGETLIRGYPAHACGGALVPAFEGRWTHDMALAAQAAATVAKSWGCSAERRWEIGRNAALGRDLFAPGGKETLRCERCGGEVTAATKQLRAAVEAEQLYLDAAERGQRPVRSTASLRPALAEPVQPTLFEGGGIQVKRPGARRRSGYR